ncbi:hypothetical protein HPC49_32080 [Pyxidicoccus fallax]|uniref:General secretion pathway protein C n=1 Tax=Pyxidicoccus fallax TaxID=394095 RepID=A0A848LSG1_9BACT|nr:type II secretion system protein GspC [Pyxidicoccus fallax]NMO20560.1 hypothetical protein [Pyxidicoccus fallax]NPC82850.1 hypothetical protein [Pyxidicoccus fallax]
MSGALILLAAPVAAGTMNLLDDFKLTRLIPGLAPEKERTARASEESAVVIERERIIIPASVHGAFGDAAEAHGTQEPARPRVSAGNPAFLCGIRAVGEHAYEVPRADVHDAFSRLEEVAMQARVVPAFRDGEPQGFKLFAIKPESIYEKLGLQNGDVLQQVNGMSLKTPQSAMNAFESLREVRHIEVDLERGGTPLRKVYDVR